MTNADWIQEYGDRYLITLTDQERNYLGLDPISPIWDRVFLCNKTWQRRATVFFEGDIIVKVISERILRSENSSALYGEYMEYDTRLVTEDRKSVLPLTARGKTKPLLISTLDGIDPFGCRFYLFIQSERETRMGLDQLRARKSFPIGERDAVAGIRTEGDFHTFMDRYIATCREDYFDKLQAFRSASKITVKYKVGDIFRMDYDRTHYCYGIITGIIRKLQAMAELPQSHSLRQLMLVPIMVRYYQLVTEEANLKAEDLKQVPLGRLNIAADNDIIWGEHTIVDHKTLDPEELEFNLICTKIRDRTKQSPSDSCEKYHIHIEWGFAQTTLRYDQLSDNLKEFFSQYCFDCGVSGCINPIYAVPDGAYHRYRTYLQNLLIPEYRSIRNELFACLGLEPDCSFDRFAQTFGGLTAGEIIARIK